jgi:hypothetical protein
MSNGKVEGLFSIMKNIQSVRRTSVGEDRLDELLRITAEGPALTLWEPRSAIKLWWEDKTRRSSSDARAPRRKSRESLASSSSAGTDDSEQTSYTIHLQDWESWINSDSSDTDDAY